MKNLFAAVLLALLAVATSVPCIEALAGELPPPPPAVGGDDVDIKLPVSAPLVSQWIVVVDGGQMQIVAARARKEDDGVVVSATVPHLSPESLRGAVATSQDGNIISTALHTAKK